MIPPYTKSNSPEAIKEHRDMILDAISSLSNHYQIQGLKKDSSEKLALQVIDATMPFCKDSYNSCIEINSQELLDSMKQEEKPIYFQKEENPYTLDKVLYFMKKTLIWLKKS